MGESGRQTVLLNVELAQHTSNPETFHRNLHGLFNDGALVLEKAIIKELFRRLGVTYEEKSDFDFVGCVNHAKRFFLTRNEEATADRIGSKGSHKDHIVQPHLKVIRALWNNSPVQISFVVVDLNSKQEYPQNFVCVFPKNLFRKNQKGNLKRSRFFHVFGETSHEVAESLLEDALKTERDREVRRQIESSLREVREASSQRM